ncbi:MAG: helix-turn-helix transcriptional regulator [Chloroflexi bacterium]|nr:helix-turn-helix transcriptional regulator [Chloroflexota bacterium]
MSDQNTQAIRPASIHAARSSLLNESARRLAQRVHVALCEPNRTQIVCALRSGPLPVTEIARVIGRARSVTTQHLRIPCEAGILSRERDGRVIRYALSGDPAPARRRK